MKNLKTSSRIALNFLIYVFLILIFAITVNIFYFYTWTNHSYDEINETITREYTEVYNNSKSLKTPAVKFTKFKDDIMDFWWYVKSSSWRIYISSWYTDIPKTNYFNIFKKDGNYFLKWWRYVTWVGDVYLFYNTFTLYASQITMLKMSLLLLFVFSFFWFYISRYLTNSSLSNLKVITQFAKNLDFNNLNKTIDISWSDDDEIKIVATALNKAISKINYKAQKLKDFSSDVAHEFKTSLMIVNSEIDYANASKKYKDSFENIKVQIKFLDYLLSSLLSLKRLEWKSMDLQKENVWAMVRSSFSEIENLFKYKWLGSELDINDDIIKKVDRSLFAVVINNLIFNAFKYTDSSKVSVKLDENSLIISDTWIWIAKENLSKIWARYYKENESKSDTNSHWLGLSLVKEIVTKHKFKIKAESEQWTGSRFIINW